MKRTSVLMILVALMCSVGFAKETEFAKDFNSKFTNGGAWTVQGEMGGGFGEYGFRLCPEENNFMLRNTIFFEGLGSSAYPQKDSIYGSMAFGDKFMIGGTYENSEFIVRTYGFFGGSIGIFKAAGKSFFDKTYMAETLCGGGFEFQYTSNLAFFIEFGGCYKFPVGTDYKKYQAFSNSAPTLTIGYRGLR